MKKINYNKTTLVRELAFSTGIKQKTARNVLDALTHIAYREAQDQGFTIPGICRLDIIRRKPRKMRNPQNGETLLIAEHDVLRARPLKKARDHVTPAPKDLITVLPAENAAPAPVLDDFSKAVSFRCKQCAQEIEAPLSAAGIIAQCPACNASVTIPSESEPGTLHGAPLPEPAPEPAPAPVPAPVPTPASPVPSPAVPPQPQAAQPRPQESKLKNQTIRIDLAALGFEAPGAPSAPKPLAKKRMLSFFCKNCRQEIEAPAEMAGTGSECPSCGVSFEVPFFSEPGTLHGSDLEPQKPDPKHLAEMKSRTIRIEVPDDI